MGKYWFYVVAEVLRSFMFILRFIRLNIVMSGFSSYKVFNIILLVCDKITRYLFLAYDVNLVGNFLWLLVVLLFWLLGVILIWNFGMFLFSCDKVVYEYLLSNKVSSDLIDFDRFRLRIRTVMVGSYGSRGDCFIKFSGVFIYMYILRTLFLLLFTFLNKFVRVNFSIRFPKLSYLIFKRKSIENGSNRYRPLSEFNKSPSILGFLLLCRGCFSEFIFHFCISLYYLYRTFSGISFYKFCVIFFKFLGVNCLLIILIIFISLFMSTIKNYLIKDLAKELALLYLRLLRFGYSIYGYFKFSLWSRLIIIIILMIIISGATHLSFIVSF